jgi:hypothetical protein
LGITKQYPTIPSYDENGCEGFIVNLGMLKPEDIFDERTLQEENFYYINPIPPSDDDLAKWEI